MDDKEAIETLLANDSFSMDYIAKALGVSRRTLYRRMKDLGIPRKRTSGKKPKALDTKAAQLLK